VSALLPTPAFWVSDRAYPWSDVVLAAELWGDWTRLARRAEEGAAVLAWAEDHAASLTARCLETRANAFRYERDLETAEDMEAWLRRWGLTAAAWRRWVRMEALRAHLCLPPGDTHPGFETGAPPAEVLCEAICSGDLERLALRLAERAAVCEMRRRRFGVCDGPDSLPGGYPPCPPGHDAARYLDVVRHDLCYLAFLDEVGTPVALEAHRVAHQLDWVQLSYQALRFPNAEQVREAAWAVSRDGLSLHQVAEAARVVVEERTEFLEDLEGPVRERLVGARPGQLVGPVPQDGDWLLVVVRNREAPSLEDPEVAQRTRASLVSSRVTREVASLVRWPRP
jgi:hypothetical protein